ncbi:MAG TPA: AMP-binding protein [Mycobacteriales bacterium]|jgi:bile acid-coenzyme A ligase|nr:AMP-binding protein [Mycobacteriales bacterium]
MAVVAPISFAQRIRDLAGQDPDRPAVTCGDRSLTRAELDRAATSLGHDLRAGGVRVGDMVTVALPNSVDWFVAFAACWKIGAIPQPVSARLPVRELTAIVELADAAAVLGVEEATFPGRRCLPVGYTAPPVDEPLPDVVSPAWKAPTSGGSTGRPKLIVSGDPSLFETDGPVPLLISPGGCMVMPGPLYHNGPLIWSWQALLWGDHVVVLPRFDAEQTLDALDRHGADIVYLVPTMMKRIWSLGEQVRGRYDLSALRVVWHLAEPCPAWLKDAWVEWLGPERIYELYGGTEGQASTIISGEEWLEHRGSVGRPARGTVTIRDEDGRDLPPRQTGEVWLKSERDTPTYRYVGAEPRRSADGWESLGDMGWLDEDGYLYLGDRASDMILTGGSNVYPAEVEAAILEHPLVHSCAVIGLPDEERGNNVHAIVQADGALLPEPELLAFVAERLVRYKVPRSVEYVSEPLRDDAGKVRRAALRAERVGPVAAG